MLRISQSARRNISVNRRCVTLLEVLCLLALVGLAAVLVVLATHPISRRSPRAQVAAARAELKALTEALQRFRDDSGRYPLGTNGLWQLIQRPKGTTNWQGPYLDVQVCPRDPWGGDYVYDYPGKHTAFGYPYDLFSLGLPGAHHLIGNWDDPDLRPR